ncbi:patatin-like phospholipase [bacterium BMS3Bbin12]|nr:patatin-like phospholipase [bacterium BMS3Abin12]GBE48718.1 patatin-like phospholipase [bacterium BMS3Bbin12]GBE50951.1 patatin-like phospholipase [bacterium BMS3Bbin13]
MAGTVRILSIDGGGIRGLIPAVLLEWLEARIGRPISETFHLIAGTSTGGILAAGLCAPRGGGPRFSAADLVGFYRDDGPEIFHSGLWHGVASLGGTVDERYPADALERVLQRRFGDLSLSQARTELLITSYDLERRNPHFFKSWKARGERLRGQESAAQREFRLRDVARATSAAPTYFEPAWVRNAAGERFALVDGGVFANNPAMCAVASARALYPKAGRYLIVSLGTGQAQRPIPYDQARDWGLIGWARPILSVIFDGVSDTVDYQLIQQFPRGYHRFQTDLSAGVNDDMDDADPDNLRRLQAKAEDLIQTRREDLRRLVRQLRRAPDPRPEFS